MFFFNRCGKYCVAAVALNQGERPVQFFKGALNILTPKNAPCRNVTENTTTVKINALSLWINWINPKINVISACLNSAKWSPLWGLEGSVAVSMLWLQTPPLSVCREACTSTIRGNEPLPTCHPPVRRCWAGWLLIFDNPVNDRFTSPHVCARSRDSHRRRLLSLYAVHWGLNSAPLQEAGGLKFE